MTKLNQKVKFTATDGETELELAVKRPDRKTLTKANEEAAKSFSDAVRAGFLLSAEIDDYLRKRNMWNDEKESYRKSIEDNIAAGKRKLAAGGIKLSEARKVALEMRSLREELRDLISARTELEGRTAEGQAENARLNYLVYASTVYNNDGKLYFKNLDDYYDKAGSDVGIKAATHLLELLSGVDVNFEDKLPENQFLKKYKFVDEQGRLINKDGKLIDAEGRLVNENNRFINENNELIDINGNRVDEDGNLLLEFEEFIDDRQESESG